MNTLERTSTLRRRYDSSDCTDRETLVSIDEIHVLYKIGVKGRSREGVMYGKRFCRLGIVGASVRDALRDKFERDAKKGNQFSATGTFEIVSFEMRTFKGS